MSKVLWSTFGIVLIGSVVLGWSGSSWAIDCGPAATSTCINADTLWPHAGPAVWVSLGSTDTVAPGELALGLVTTYQSRPIVLHSPSPGPPGTDFPVIDNQVNGNFLFAFGITRRFEFDIVIPVTFGQTGTGLAPITGGAGLQVAAVRDMRFGWTFSLLQPDRPIFGDRKRSSWAPHWGLAGRFEMAAPTGDHTEFAGERTAVFVPSLAASVVVKRLSMGVELGARLRGTTDLLGARVGSQMSIAVGLAYDLLARPELLGVAVEARALPTLVTQITPAGPRDFGLPSTSNSNYLIPSEWLISLRSAPWKGGGWSFQAGGGGPLGLGEDSITTPRFRFILGLRYAPRARDRF